MPLTEQTLLSQIAAGEDSGRQFKRDAHNAESLAAEMAAFANSEGGVIYLGVDDAGQAVGLAQADVVRLNQLIGNAASQLVRSPLAVRTENVLLTNGRVVIALNVPKGLDKPGPTSAGSTRRRNCAGFSSYPGSSTPTNCPPRRTSIGWTSCASGIFCAIITSRNIPTIPRRSFACSRT